MTDKEIVTQDISAYYNGSKGGNKASGIDTGWENPPSLSDLKKDYEYARNKHEAHIKRIEHWLDALHVRGEYKVEKRAGRSTVSPRLVRRIIEWKTPSLSQPFLSNPKLIEVSPRTWDDKDAAEQNEVILNYQLKNKINLVGLLDDITRSMETEGTAVLKPSWNYKSNLIRDKKEIYDYEVNPELAAVYDTLLMQLEQNPDLINGLSTEIERGLDDYVNIGEAREYYLKEVIEVEREKVTLNQPSVVVAENDRVFPDPDCKSDFNKCRYVVHSMDVCLADLKEAGIYQNLDKVESYVSAKESNNRSKQADSSRKNFEMFEYWGYWDINNDGVLTPIVAAWVDSILIQLDISPYSSGKLPFIFMRLNNLNKDSLFGEAEAELIGENQKILGALLRGAIDLMGRSAAGQKGFAKGFLDPQNKAKFDKGENYEFGVNHDPAKSIYTHEFPVVSSSVITLMQYANNDSDAMTGVQAFSEGVNSNSMGNVVAGMQGAISAAAKRESAILHRIAQGFTELAYFFIELNGMFLTDTDIIRLTSKEFQQVDPENLSGDFDLVLDIASAEADAANIANLSMLLQVGQTSLPFEFTKRILSSIARLARLSDLEQFIEEYQPEPDPVQEQKNQLELALLEAEVAEQQAKVDLARAEAAVKWNEAGVRVARAESITADTDKKNIENYKTISGYSQKEELERIQAQTEGKAYLESVKQSAAIDRARMSHNFGLKNKLADDYLSDGGTNKTPTPKGDDQQE